MDNLLASSYPSMFDKSFMKLPYIETGDNHNHNLIYANILQGFLLKCDQIMETDVWLDTETKEIESTITCCLFHNMCGKS